MIYRKRNNRHRCGSNCNHRHSSSNRLVYCEFPRLPTHLASYRVDGWYMNTLRALGIWRDGDMSCNSNCITTRRRSSCSTRRVCNHITIKSVKPENFYLFQCLNHKCDVDMFIANERCLTLISTNRHKPNRLYSTRCTCGLVCVSSEIYKEDEPCEESVSCRRRCLSNKDKMEENDTICQI